MALQKYRELHRERIMLQSCRSSTLFWFYRQSKYAEKNICKQVKNFNKVSCRHLLFIFIPVVCNLSNSSCLGELHIFSDKPRGNVLCRRTVDLGTKLIWRPCSINTVTCYLGLHCLYLNEATQYLHRSSILWYRKRNCWTL